ncbi:phosphatase PAP2 family protein [Spongisporangium articulatum]|uniref:Phosphatase PAP2 family protein n=1 Tax=Spongisporangium articulatum TaxID=3362603 RepID=A0ABW8ANA5_9ACTN
MTLAIGELTVNQHAWYALDQRWSQRVFDYARYRPHVRAIAEVVGHVTEPWVWRIVVLLAATLLWRRGRGSAALWWIATMAVAGLAGIGLKVLVARSRPDWPGSYVHIDGYTFPSGHAVNVAAFTASTAAVLWPVIGPRLRVLTATVGTVLALGVGADRVLLGVHHVSDVVAGWALGLAVVAAFSAFGVDDASWPGRASSAVSQHVSTGARIAVGGVLGVAALAGLSAIAPTQSPLVLPGVSTATPSPTPEEPHVQGTYSPPPDPFPGAHGGAVPIEHPGRAVDRREDPVRFVPLCGQPSEGFGASDSADVPRGGTR